MLLSTHLEKLFEKSSNESSPRRMSSCVMDSHRSPHVGGGMRRSSSAVFSSILCELPFIVSLLTREGKLGVTNGVSASLLCPSRRSCSLTAFPGAFWFCEKASPARSANDGSGDRHAAIGEDSYHCAICSFAVSYAFGAFSSTYRTMGPKKKCCLIPSYDIGEGSGAGRDGRAVCTGIGPILFKGVVPPSAC